jgi:amino acid transporter
METRITSQPTPPHSKDVVQARPTGLVRALGPVMATAVVVGTVIGSGVFKKPSAVAEQVPNFTCVAMVWILGGLLALLGSLALAEVAVLFPQAGGNYVFLREGFGRLAGFLWGWVEFWIIRTASIAALATIFTESLHDVFRAVYELPRDVNVITYWEEQMLTVAVIVALALVNVRGVKWGGLLQVFITTVKVGSLLAILLLPFFFLGRLDALRSTSANADADLPPFSLSGLGKAMLGVLWAYHGWMNIAPVAGEVKRPQRNIPVALLGGVGIIIFLYLGANVAYHLVIPLGEMKGLQNTPVVTEFCLRLLGPVGATLASAAVMCSVFGALNGNLLVGPRLLFAMGQDDLAPHRLRAVSPRYHTPALAIIVMAVWSCLLVLLGAMVKRFGVPAFDPDELSLYLMPAPRKSLFDMLTDFAMFGAIIFETLAVATIFRFRSTLPLAERPYRCPGYPVVPILYVAILAAVAVNTLLTQTIEPAVGLGFMVLGAVVYAIWLRQPRRAG